MQADQHVAMEIFWSGDSNILVATSGAEGLDVHDTNLRGVKKDTARLINGRLVTLRP